ncbi:MAG: Coenzyme F420 hydrogenase/dehydrogenase, beta subunit C-terminal domain [Lutisporaceae bacterium]
MTSYFQSGGKNLCCGCRGCEQICPTKAIEMTQDNEGFLYPYINIEKCINCGMCEKVCPIKDGGYKNKDVLINPEVYGAYNKDEHILSESTSGGAFTAIIDSFFEDDIVVFGAEYDDNLVVRHTFIEEKRSINKFRGSKYVQSDLGYSYSKVKEFLANRKKILFSGTPCQVAGLKSFLGTDDENLLCVDIVCHGVPSPKVFELYKKYLEEKNESNLVEVNFRDKSKKGWSTPFVSHIYDNGIRKYEVHSDDEFIIGFYKNYYIRPICHSCPFAKVPRVSDITIADFWGVEEINPEFKNNRGTSLILINTLKAKGLYNKLEEYLILEETCLKDAAKYNPQLSHSTTFNPLREQFMDDMINGVDFVVLRKKYLKKRHYFKRLISKMLDKKLKSRIKKILRV